MQEHLSLFTLCVHCQQPKVNNIDNHGEFLQSKNLQYHVNTQQRVFMRKFTLGHETVIFSLNLNLTKITREPKVLYTSATDLEKGATLCYSLRILKTVSPC